MKIPSVSLGLLMLLLLPTGAAAAGKCAEGGEYAAAVLAARNAVQAQCDCAGAASRKAYQQCVQGAVKQLALDGALPATCRGRVRQYALRSTCGRDGILACCVKRSNGRWRALLRPAARGCTNRPTDVACEASFPHLDDACLPDGECRVSACGDAILDPAGGEECEPPGTPTCDALCHTRTCGDGVVNPDNEQCEPPNTSTCDSACQIRCGNGVIDFYFDEECEPPGVGTCNASCQYDHTCGDGVVELGEECDGQPHCNASCRLIRTQCCQIGGWCFDGTATHIVDEYFFSKDCGYLLGGVPSYGECVGAEPCPDVPPTLGCKIGSCTATPIEPLPLCCQHVDGTCTGTIATTTSALGGCGWGTFPPPGDGPLETLIVGTCGADGRCIPGG